MGSTARAVRVAGRRLLPAVVAGLGLLLTLVASPADAATTLSVTTPAGGAYIPGRPAPLLVTIEADRAVSGTLTATFDGQPGGSQRVETPGGSAKQIVFVVDTLPFTSSGQISFRSDSGSDNATARLNLTSVGTDEMVAVLPSLTTGRSLPATARLTVDVGTARLFPLDPALLSFGPDVLSPFNQIVATSTDLTRLAPDQLDTVRNWVATSGGTLVLDDKPGTAIPLATGTTAADTSAAASGPGASASTFGVGQIRFASGQAGAGRYDGLLSPTTSKDPQDTVGGFQGIGAPTTVLLAADAGVRIPAIGSLLALLALYTVVAGPLLWLVLKRSRRETMLWVALPAVAAVVTMAVYGLGLALRHDTNAAHATVVADLPASRVTTTEVLVTAPGGGRAGVHLGDGWRPASTLSDQSFVGVVNQTDAALHQRQEGDDLVVDLPSGGAGVVTAESALPAAQPSWAFDLKADGGTLRGTVTNLTDHTLHEVFVTAGQAVAELADIGPGASAPVTLIGADQPPLIGDDIASRMTRSDPFRPDDGPANPAVLSDWLAGHRNLQNPGYVLAVGWTRDGAGPLRTLGDQAVDRGRTAYLTAGPVPDDAAFTRFELLRGSSTRVADSGGAGGFCGFSTTIRLTPPALRPGQQAVLELSSHDTAAFDVWNGSTWQPAGMASARSADLVVGLPGAALTDGSVYLRVQSSCDSGKGPGAPPRLRVATSKDQILTLGALDKPARQGPDA